MMLGGTFIKNHSPLHGEDQCEAAVKRGIIHGADFHHKGPSFQDYVYNTYQSMMVSGVVRHRSLTIYSTSKNQNFDFIVKVSRVSLSA